MMSLQDIQYLIQKIECTETKTMNKLKDIKKFDDNKNQLIIQKIQTEFGEKKFIKP